MKRKLHIWHSSQDTNPLEAGTIKEKDLKKLGRKIYHIYIYIYDIEIFEALFKEEK